MGVDLLRRGWKKNNIRHTDFRECIKLQLAFDKWVNDSNQVHEVESAICVHVFIPEYSIMTELCSVILNLANKIILYCREIHFLLKASILQLGCAASKT